MKVPPIRKIVRRVLIAFLALGGFALLLLPFALEILTAWESSPTDRKTHKFKDSDITFRTWHFTHDPLDTHRREYRFEIQRNGEAVVSDMLYDTFDNSEVLLCPLHMGKAPGIQNLYGMYLLHHEYQFGHGDEAALVLFDASTGQWARNDSTDGFYIEDKWRNDEKRWIEAFRLFAQRFGLRFFQ